MELKRNKIINDPVHGFISVPGGLIYNLVEHPFFQRLRYIKQLGLTEFVYPGATHSRFQHSLGALHLMGLAIQTLRQKSIDISIEEEEAVLVAILLHDIGHGPFSHALEHIFINRAGHEEMSLLIMRILNEKYNGRLDLAIDMFLGNYSRQFFHDLISSQIDMDRLDYLVRDSFFSGVIEGSVGSGRIIEMLNVSDNRLVVDIKGIYSIENFLIARRLMYWQVYMHKTVVSAERLVISMINRVKELIRAGVTIPATPVVKYFLEKNYGSGDVKKVTPLAKEIAARFLSLDDNEMLSSVRMWRESSDIVLSDLSRRIIERDLLAIELDNDPFDKKKIDQYTILAKDLMGSDHGATGYYVFTGSVSNRAYAPSAPSVKIMDKDGNLRKFTEVSDMFDHKSLSRKITKFFLCYPKEIRGRS
ncbi:MAG: HD domain-containing protein [Bacteroidales bacterium]|nr:HD domain-containing protein [Bacteroidales bacterium]